MTALHVVKVIVRFADGTEQVRSGAVMSPSLALSSGIQSAESAKGEPHAGAWLEFT